MSYSTEYIEKELIGRGHYGRVYLVYHKQTSKAYCAKKIQFQGMSQQQRQSTLKEVNIHRNLKHNNILEFKQYFLQSQILIMIMDYCQFGDLSMYIKNRKQTGQLFDESLIIHLFVQMLFGLNYLHQHKILHRDIKTQNIFIDSEGTIKLADFGISKMLQNTQHLASTVVGTPYYLSPQACGSKGYSFKSDIWSLGCVLYQLCCLQYPFKGDNILLLAKKISTQQPKQIPESYSKQLGNLIKVLLRKNSSQRPTIKQILQTKYISQYLKKFKISDCPQKYPIFQTQQSLENEFLDLQYVNGNVVKMQSPSQPKNNKAIESPLQRKVNKIDEIKITPKKSGVQNLRKKCIDKMGENLFYEIYNFMINSRKAKTSQAQVQQRLKSMYSKKEFQMSMDVAQLIYLEDSERN